MAYSGEDLIERSAMESAMESAMVSPPHNESGAISEVRAAGWGGRGGPMAIIQPQRWVCG